MILYTHDSYPLGLHRIESWLGVRVEMSELLLFPHALTQEIE